MICQMSANLPQLAWNWITIHLWIYELVRRCSRALQFPHLSSYECHSTAIIFTTVYVACGVPRPCDDT